MSGKIEYLEKYSIAPSPSRDYYGLKILRDQVILYLWKISHGPHKTPIVRISSFADFGHDKLLQDEIRRAFGKHLLRHARNIASGRRNTFLTLPKSLIERLVGYLSVSDIVKLTSLSHVAKEIFNDNSVWETLYKKYKPLMKSKYETFYTTTPNWKQLFQQAQIQILMNDQKLPRARQSTKQTKTFSKFEDSSKPSSASSRGTAKIVSSAPQALRKPSEESRKKTIQTAVSKKLSEIRLLKPTVENERIGSERRVPIVKSFQMTGQKSIKPVKDQSKAVTRNEPRRDTENKSSLVAKQAEVRSNKGQSKVRRTDVSSTSVKTTEEKASTVKTRCSSSAKATRNEKLVPSSTLGDQSKPKPKGKTKKIGQSKSTILNTNTALAGSRSLIRDDSFDLADLIEASLKNIRSPRSIFDYNFSCIDKAKSCAGDGKGQDEHRRVTESLRTLKSGRVRATLDRLSEKSEPLTAKSTESLDRSDVSVGSVASKNMNTANKSAKSKKDQCKITEDKADNFERYGIYGKYPTPRINESVEQKSSTSRKTITKMDMLRSLGTNSLCGRTVTSGRAAGVSRYELRKMVGSFCKQ